MTFGIFDSGIGGLFVMGDLVRQCPGKYIYYADTDRAPFGNLSKQAIEDITFEAIEKLQHEGADIVVLACNTATANAVQAARKKFDLPIIGIEPAIKPAAATHTTVACIATPALICSEKYQKLRAQFDNVVDYPLPHLASEIEDNILYPTNLDALAGYVERLVSPAKTVCLGCTHYLALKGNLQRLGLRTFDGNQGIVHRLQSLSGILAQSTAESTRVKIDAQRHSQTYQVIFEKILQGQFEN